MISVEIFPSRDSCSTADDTRDEPSGATPEFTFSREKKKRKKKKKNFANVQRRLFLYVSKRSVILARFNVPSSPFPRVCPVKTSTDPRPRERARETSVKCFIFPKNVSTLKWLRRAHPILAQAQHNTTSPSRRKPLHFRNNIDKEPSRSRRVHITVFLR